MTIDAGGNVSLAGDGVTAVDEAGRKAEASRAPGPWTAGVCFDGRAMRPPLATAPAGTDAGKMWVNGAAMQ